MFRTISGSAQLNSGKMGKTQKSTNNLISSFGLIEKKNMELSLIYQAVHSLCQKSCSLGHTIKKIHNQSDASVFILKFCISVPRFLFGKEPVEWTCQNCNNNIITNVHKEIAFFQWVLSGCLCMFGKTSFLPSKWNLYPKIQFLA